MMMNVEYTVVDNASHVAIMYILRSESVYLQYRIDTRISKVELESF